MVSSRPSPQKNLVNRRNRGKEEEGEVCVLWLLVGGRNEWDGDDGESRRRRRKSGTQTAGPPACHLPQSSHSQC